MSRRRPRARSLRRSLTAFRFGLREYLRTPVLLALIVFLPAYAVGVFAYLAPDTPAIVRLSDGAPVQVSLADAFPALTTPMAAALLTGLAGLFLVYTAADADDRLAIAGYRPHEIVLARLGLLAVIAAASTTVAVGVMLATFVPESPGWFVAATFLAAVSYGLVGVLAGTLLDRIVGVYLILFGSLVDLFLFQNPMAADSPAMAELLPGHYPLKLGVDAGFGEAIELEPVGYALVVVAALTLLSIATLYRTAR